MIDNIISRADAQASGRKTYVTGIPCPHGHAGVRRVSNGSCVECSNEVSNAWYRRNRERVLADRKDWYQREGRSKKGYPAPSYAPPGYCEICGTTTPSGKGTWHLDHDHVTGAFRGWLCNNCNGGIGLLQDDPNILRAAIAYLGRAPQARAA